MIYLHNTYLFPIPTFMDLIAHFPNVLLCQASTWTSGQRPSAPIWAPELECRKIQLRMIWEDSG